MNKEHGEAVSVAIVRMASLISEIVDGMEDMLVAEPSTLSLTNNMHETMHWIEHALRARDYPRAVNCVRALVKQSLIFIYKNERKEDDRRKASEGQTEALNNRKNHEPG